MTSRIAISSIVLAMALIKGAPGWAAPLLFSYEDASAGKSVSFILDSNPAPLRSTMGFLTTLSVTAGTENGRSASGLTAVDFYNGAAFFGGFGTEDLFVTAVGPQLYSGTESRPMFSTGGIPLTDAFDSTPGVLTITDVSAAPEPSTWVLMIAGFGLAGISLRRRTMTARSREALAYRFGRALRRGWCTDRQTAPLR